MRKYKPGTVVQVNENYGRDPENPIIGKRGVITRMNGEDSYYDFIVLFPQGITIDSPETSPIHEEEVDRVGYYHIES